MKEVGPVQVLLAAARDQTGDMQPLQFKAFINGRLEKSSTVYTEAHWKRGAAVVANTGPLSRLAKTLRNYRTICVVR